MERPTGDGSTAGGSLVPLNASMVLATDVPAVNPAGLNPAPMTVDQDIFVQPVQAYFQFVQNNLLFLDESNIDQVRREAEKRNTQLMQQKWYSNCVVILNPKAFRCNKHAWVNYCSSVPKPTNSMNEMLQSCPITCFRAPLPSRKSLIFVESLVMQTLGWKTQPIT